MAKKLGKSLSFCIKDIISGKVNVEDVSAISTGTKIPDDNVLEEVIEQYRKSYWRDDPDLGEEICRKLFEEGRIFQPRLKGETPLLKGGDWWVDLTPPDFTPEPPFAE